MNLERPVFSGLRVMMMPFHTHDARGSLPVYVEAHASLSGPGYEVRLQVGPHRFELVGILPLTPESAEQMRTRIAKDLCLP